MVEPSRDEMHALYVQALGRITALGPEGCAERVGPWLCVDAGLGVSDFNIAVVVDAVTNPRAAVRQATAWFGQRGINCRLDLRGSVDGTVLAAAMVEGFVFKFREAVMLLHPLPLAFDASSELLCRAVTTPEDLDLYCAVDREEYHDQEFQRAMVERASTMEGVSLQLGLSDGWPVARSMTIQRDDLVGLYNVYVPPSQRRKGFGRAITVSALSAAQAAGATAACLEATALGRPLYAAMGFRHVDDYVVVGTPGPVFPD